MKSLLTIQILFFSFCLIGQTPMTTALEGKVSGVNIFREDDGSPKVIKLKTTNNQNNILFFVNDELIEGQALNHINPDSIESMEVVKEDILQNNKKYEGAIYITLKNNFAPSFISLNALKEKYLDLKDLPTIFLIDGKSIQDDYNTYLVDEKNILNIKHEELKNEEENYNLMLIRIETRSFNKRNK